MTLGEMNQSNDPAEIIREPMTRRDKMATWAFISTLMGFTLGFTAGAMFLDWAAPCSI